MIPSYIILLSQATIFALKSEVRAHFEPDIALGESEDDKRTIEAIDYDTEVAKQMPKTIEKADEVCYPSVGCFSRHHSDRMTHPKALPQDPQDIGTDFLLYTRHNPVNPLSLTRPNFAGIREGQLDSPKDLTVLVHGFTQDRFASWVQDAKAALLQQTDSNVVVVDWPRGCQMPHYLQACGNSALVGRQISIMLQTLIDQFSVAVHPDRIHVIGFSLGAQVTGFCGRHFTNSTGTRLSRITALDAAGPLFEDTNVHVARTDAHFVDVIHTSYGWNVLNGDLGMEKAIGHVDFYPNHEHRQPGCELFSLSCAHARAPVYFLESLRLRSRCKFVSRPCADELDPECDVGAEGEMGYWSPLAPGRGRQYLTTNSQYPFCDNTPAA